MSDVAINLDVELHPKQAEFFEAMCDPTVVEVYARKGRRAGGTFAVALATTKFALDNPCSPAYPNKPTEIAFVGPMFANAKRVYAEIIDSFGSVIVERNKSELSLVWSGGARGQCYSSENISGILGAGFDIVEIDEASNFPEDLVRSHVTPTLADRGGRLFVVSSPRHGALNWFAVKALEAESGKIPNVRGFHFTTYDNPRVSRAWIEAQRAKTDVLTWQEEYEALVLSTSASWLDPSLIRYVDTKDIPANTLNVVIADFAWGDPEPGMVDETTRRRKDANVIAVFSQDERGNVYLRRGSVYEKYLEPSVGFTQLGKMIRDYGCLKMCVEREPTVGNRVDDFFGRLWKEYRERHGLPLVGLVRPRRHAHWKTSAIRMWSRLLTDRKFYIENGCELTVPLHEEMTRYSEAAVAKNRCHDDVLVVCSDILQAGIWQGRVEHQAAVGGPVTGRDIYHLKEAREAYMNETSPQRSRQTRYGPI